MPFYGTAIHFMRMISFNAIKKSIIILILITHSLNPASKYFYIKLDSFPIFYYYLFLYLSTQNEITFGKK